MRLIDADALLENAKKYVYQSDMTTTIALGIAETWIKDAPTVDAAPVVSHWINVNDRMPVETHSIFWPWYGRKEWSNAMWREQSDKVLVTVTFKDGTRLVATGETHDGEWHTSISKTLNPIVTHWMQLPEPPKEDDDDEVD